MVKHLVPIIKMGDVQRIMGAPLEYRFAHTEE